MATLRRFPSIILIAAVTIAFFLVLAWVLQSQRGASPAAASAAERPSPDEVITEAEARVAADPNFVPGLVTLAEGYFARTGQTGNPRWLVKADEAGRRAVAADPSAFAAYDALAVIAASRHRFEEALAFTRRSLTIAPTRVAPVSIQVDSLIELGRYRQGFAAAQRRLELRPDLGSYSRASYARELVGDRAGAVRLMRLAIGTTPPGSGDRATARAQLGLILLDQGDIRAAEREVRSALAELPGDTNATFVLARALVDRGELAEAEPLLEKVVADLPEPDHLAALAEVERALGDHAASRGHVAEMRRAFDDLEASGSNVDLDRPMMEADFRRPTPGDVAMARRGQRTHPSISADQALGWVLTRTGRCAEGDRYATRSLRLGTKDALLLFHAGIAASCNGRRGVARQRVSAALELNPNLTLRWAETARRELAALAS